MRCSQCTRSSDGQSAAQRDLRMVNCSRCRGVRDGLLTRTPFELDGTGQNPTDQHQLIRSWLSFTKNSPFSAIFERVNKAPWLGIPEAEDILANDLAARLGVPLSQAMTLMGANAVEEIFPHDEPALVVVARQQIEDSLPPEATVAHVTQAAHFDDQRDAGTLPTTFAEMTDTNMAWLAMTYPVPPT